VCVCVCVCVYVCVCMCVCVCVCVCVPQDQLPSKEGLVLLTAAEQGVIYRFD
jgi:hypothetical protein